MQEIVVINDDSRESLRAAEYAFNLAVTYEKNIVIVNLTEIEEKHKAYSFIRVHDLLHSAVSADEISPANNAGEYLRSFRRNSGFSPQIKSAPKAVCEGRKLLIQYINSNPVWMIVMPAASKTSWAITLNMQAVMNRIQCPIMIIPDGIVQKAIERIVYLADLRYAQIPVLRYLSKFDKHEENIILAHRCAPGLPELERAYANDLFVNGLCRNIHSQRIFYTQIPRREMEAAVDSVIHGMQADMLVCVNRHFHFSELVGKDVMSKLPGYVNIPILVFPN